MSAAADSSIPFVGLRPFDQGDARWFKGRSVETTALTRKISAARFTAVVGASGSGKSSLVRAGVLPVLYKQGWVAVVAKPGSAPIARLATALVKAAATDDDPLQEACRYRYAAALRGSAYGLAEIARDLLPDVPGVVLVIDQFEELFRFGDEAQGAQKAAMQEESRAFVELFLTATAHARDRLRVVITMRSDFFGNCATYAGLAEAVSASQYLVPAPDRDNLMEAIHEPIAEAGAEIEDALVQRLLLDVEEQQDPLPTLQHTLRRLWESAKGEPKQLREKEYADVGRIAGSIDLKANDVLDKLRRANPADERTLACVMKAITALDDQGRATRRPQRRGELLELLGDRKGRDARTSEASLDRVLAALAREDISFVQLGDAPDPEIDIGHEALIRSWRKLSGPERDFHQGWLVEERESGRQWRELVARAERGERQTFADWQRTRTWMRGNRIGEVWARRYGNRWEDVYRLRRRSILISVLLTFLLVLAFGLLASVSARAVKKQQAEALRFAKAGARAAAGYAESLLQAGNARSAALIALAVVPESRSKSDPRYMPEVDATLARSLNQTLIETKRIATGGGGVSTTRFFPNGRHVAEGSADGVVRVWDAITGQPFGDPMAGRGSIDMIAISPDGQRVASAGTAPALRLWDSATRKPVGDPLLVEGHAYTAAFSPDGKMLAVGVENAPLHIWDLKTMSKKELVGTGADSILAIAFALDGSRVAAGDFSGHLRMWLLPTRSLVFDVQTENAVSIQSLAFSPDGRHLAAGLEDGTVGLWDARNGDANGQIGKANGRIFDIAYSPDGKHLLSGSDDGTIRLWSPTRYSQTGNAARASGSVYSVAFSGNGRHAVSGSGDGILRFWQITPYPDNDSTLPMSAGVRQMAALPNDDKIAVLSSERALLIRNLAGEQVASVRAETRDPLRSIAISPDGRFIVSGSLTGKVQQWDGVSLKPIGAPIQAHSAGVLAVAYSSDGRRIASASEDTTVRLWDAATGKRIAELPGHASSVSTVAFSPDSTRIASGSADGVVFVWDSATAAAIGPPISDLGKAVTTVAFSPDSGRSILSVSADALRLWDAATLKPITEPMWTRSSFFSAAFSPDGRRIVAIDQQGSISFWDSATGMQIGNAFTAHGDGFLSVIFTRDGRRIISANTQEKSIRIWDAGMLVAPLAELAARADALCPLSVDEQRALHLYDPESDASTREMTESQRRACGLNATAATQPGVP